MEELTINRKIELIDILIEKQQAGIILEEPLSNYMCHDIITALGRKYSSENLKYLIEVFPEFEAFLNKGGKELNSTYKAVYTIKDDSLYSEAWAGYLNDVLLSEVCLCEFKIKKLKEFIETLKKSRIMKEFNTKEKINLILHAIERQQHVIDNPSLSSPFMCHDFLKKAGYQYSISEHFDKFDKRFPEFEKFIDGGGKELNPEYDRTDSMNHAWGTLKISELDLAKYKIKKLKEFLKLFKPEDNERDK